MRKAAALLGAALVLPGLLLIVWMGVVATAVSAAVAPYDVIINEWSQGNGGSKEWVELLVTNGPLDLRGWDLGDDSPGDLTFADHPLWSHVRAGALIVVYNGSDRDTVLPPDDDDLTDCVVVLAHNSHYFSGVWPAFANGNPSDVPHLRAVGGATIHDYAVDPGPSRHPGTRQNASYWGGTAAGVAGEALWIVGSAENDASPGRSNGGANSAWIAGLDCLNAPPEPDLYLAKAGPATAAPGIIISYSLSFGNQGAAPATAVILTDTLPPGFDYFGDDGGYPVGRPRADTVVWTIGDLPPGATTGFHLYAVIDPATAGPATNRAVIATADPESHTANNQASATTLVGGGALEQLLIDAVYYESYELFQPDEAVALRNIGPGAAFIGGWQLSNGTSTAILPPDATIPPYGAIWLTKQATAFARQFGFAPDYETDGSDPAVRDLGGTWPRLSDSGATVILRDDRGEQVDVMVYKAGNTGIGGWSGAAVQPYTAGGLFGARGQILYRRRDPGTGQPVPDTNTANDWASMLGDVHNGRKVRYPGWDLDDYYFTQRLTETAQLTIAIAPDNAFETLKNEIDSATESLQIVALTFEHVGIAEALIAAANRGVAVTIFLEGGPVGGLSDQSRYICQELEAAGAQCWFMINESDQQIYDRYRFMHAKYAIVDGDRAIVSSENLSPNSLPDDDKSSGTWGRRGVLLVTDAPGVVAYLETLLALDLDPTNHVDILRWTADHPVYGDKYGRPPPDFIPETVSGGITYTVRYSAPAIFSGTFPFELIQSPENSLHAGDGLLGLVNRAGAGDAVWVQQLNERPYWGPSSSNPADDPNPRLEAYIAAARRGADVRLLLDGFFDNSSGPVSNWSTCRYAQAVAQAERLRLSCALGNPAGLGIHNKMVLVRINGRGYAHIGSLNGTEQSHKDNRELVLQFQSDAVHELLAGMFDRDWPYRVHLPFVANNLQGRANHLLISEVLYDPAGPDGAEFVEIVNPTPLTVDMSDFSLGDAVYPTDFEDVRRFPAGTTLAPGAVLVVAFSAADFRAKFGFNPDFEIDESDPNVPNLIDDPNWGHPAAIFQLGNSGDEVILRDAEDRVIDVLAYGTGSFPGVVSYNPLPPPNSDRSLERFPYWRDTDDCNVDFRERALPNPGVLPQVAPGTAVRAGGQSLRR